MTSLSRLRSTAAALLLAAASLGAQGPSALPDSTVPSEAQARLERLQASLVQEAAATHRARVLTTLPTGWQSVLRDVERATDRQWVGLPPVVLIVPSVGGRGFACDERDICLGRFKGATLTVRTADTTLTATSSIILLAESALSRPDVWAHELTHALLSQHGMYAESRRHDRRYFSEAQFVMLDF